MLEPRLSGEQQSSWGSPPARWGGRVGYERGCGSPRAAFSPLLTCYLGRRAELLPAGLKPSSPIGKKLKF